MPRRPQCSSCVYYIDEECRRNPPLVVETHTGRQTVFPTPVRTDWCGEHKKKNA